MAHRFENTDRTTPLLLPPDLRDWIAEDDLVHFVIQAVERHPLAAVAVNHKGCGDEQYPPHTMLALLIYCYANGIFSPRRIERATYRDVAVRHLTADTHPDHDTICAFRRNNFAAIAVSFVDVLELARELKLLQKMDAACAQLEARAQARAAAQRADYEPKVAARQQREGPAKGPEPKPPQATPAPDEQINLTDPDARLMRKSKHEGYTQSYNAQAVVTAGGSQLIVGQRVSDCASDAGQLEPGLQSIPETLVQPTTALADCGQIP